MNSTKTDSGIGKTIKTLLVTFIRFLAILFGFLCKLIGLILTKISEIIDKILDRGHH